MKIVSLTDYQRRFGRHQDCALVEPVMMIHGGRERSVIMAAEEYHRLKQFDRQSFAISELSDDDLAAIESARYPRGHAHLDKELSD